MLTALFAAVLLGGASLEISGQVAVITAQPSPPPARNQSADADAETVRVCRFETVTGSNRRNRVCRNVPRRSVQDQQTREFMRDSQRYTPQPAG